MHHLTAFCAGVATSALFAVSFWPTPDSFRRDYDAERARDLVAYQGMAERARLAQDEGLVTRQALFRCEGAKAPTMADSPPMHGPDHGF